MNSTSDTSKKQTLFEALGGLSTLQKVHKIFYDKVYAHPWIGQFFAGFNQQVIEDKQTAFMAEKMGSPEEYRGKPIPQVHENMYLTPELVELRHTLLKESIAEAGVPADLAERWLRIDSAFSKLVTKESLESFYRDYHFTHKERIIIPNPQESQAG
jgi:hemoglobin